MLARPLPALLGLALTACATPGSPPAGAPIPMPEGCREPVERAVDVGRQLALQDALQRWAGRAAVQRGLETRWIVASVVTHDARGWVVHFVARDDRGAVTERARVAFSRPAFEAAEVTLLGTPAPLDPESALLFEIVDQATAKPLPRCGAGWGSVVLPGALVGEEDWQVYLLQRGREDEWVLGGHVLRTVVPDARYVVDDLLLTPRCHAIPVGSGTAQVADRTECPRELHVYNALLHGRPMLLDTPAGRWRIEGDRVEFLSADAGIRPRPAAP